MRVNGTLVVDKMRRFKGECEHFRFNKCPIYTHDGASAKFSTNSQEMQITVCFRSKAGSGNICFKFAVLCLCSAEVSVGACMTDILYISELYQVHYTPFRRI